ncbi:MAG: hypothetical protein AB7T48_05545 [Solirubrobacterales bacterium]
MRIPCLSAGEAIDRRGAAGAGIEADLGALGKIDVDYVSTGGREKVRSQCGEDSAVFSRASYVGAIEFHGEEGYTEVSTERVRIDYSFFIDLVCGGTFELRTWGPDLPGARFLAHARGRTGSLSLELKKNRPRAGTTFGAELAEKRDGISIRRSVGGTVGAGAFLYGPDLRTARLDLPSPFAGRAAFHRNAKRANRWTGNLTVDFPGHSDVPLTGTAFKTSLVHSNWTRSVTHYDRPAWPPPRTLARRAPLP